MMPYGGGEGDQYNEKYENNKEDQEEGINSDTFSKKKNLFRVEIRKKRTKELLQAKRNKVNPENFQQIQPFYPEILLETVELLDSNIINIEQIVNNFQVIDNAISYQNQFGFDVSTFLKSSSLFTRLLEIICLGRGGSFEVFLNAYHLIVNLLASSNCQDVADYIANILLSQGKNGKMENQENNKLFDTNREIYQLSFLEEHLKDDEDMDIRENAIMLISNLAAENSQLSRKTLLSKGGLFSIIKENLEEKNYNENILECLVDLISNLCLNDQWYSFQDFQDLPPLLEILFQLLKPESKEVCNLLEAFSRIVSNGDDDNLHSLVNNNFSLITMIYNFISASDFQSDVTIKSIKSCLEILFNICNQFETLTQQAVEMGLFDPISQVLMRANSTELIDIALEILEICFSKQSFQIHEFFLNDKTFNENQALTKKIFLFVNMGDPSLQNTALMTLSSLISHSSEEHCQLIFKGNRMLLAILESLKSEAIKPETISYILNALCNLIQAGNLSYQAHENPYTISFCEFQGFQILDEIENKLSEEAYFHSQRLVELLTQDDNIYE